MNSRLLVILIVGLSVIGAFWLIVTLIDGLVVSVNGNRAGQKSVYVTPAATPLLACQSVPPNLSEDLRSLYIRICSTTNAEQRIYALVAFPKIHVSERASAKAREGEMQGIKLGSSYIYQSEMVACLPLLAEIMTTDDYDPRRGRYYVAKTAAEVMSGAGAYAVPFVITALKSKNTMEVHSALVCARDIITHLEWRGETNEFPAICGDLLPYVRMWATNELGITIEAGCFGRTIPDDAKITEEALRQFLPPATSKE